MTDDKRGRMPAAQSCNSVVQRNIRDVIQARKRIERRESGSERIARKITELAGNMGFAYFHCAWFGVWIAFNLWTGERAFDPFPFVLLITVVSLEAIFLTLMVLVSQNREAKLEEQRADLDLQIDLLAEYEVTRLLCLVSAIAKKLEIDDTDDEDMKELLKTVRPKDLLDELETLEERKAVP
ncbi:DUF1003 domain-containing protein [Planctomyces sp. SH-PL14]|uniref:DUF1003 domain-containing protein n=1 Tax=Planctomyces sp. SH-PL14 TaxID=1632864 RepID=UPI00078C7A17|nr:DUF1003 domain-containing protein [Planctomyces sp. SH-PL14]AMV19578.1 hypothetical protein VT03_16910 [Planctomyces sp. SH-PL14]